jgi:hypothetical protein
VFFGGGAAKKTPQTTDFPLSRTDDELTNKLG